ncbi:vitamin K epoxide reductase family protein [Candidatus Woesearchaeota archaeon]|nr:vitamin K epoxide reductase family protein [Candidatus Woesearchaeota archaeon]
MKRKIYIVLIMFLAVIGMSISLVLLNIHIENKNNIQKDRICNINEQFSCDTVDNSPYSQIFGVPISFIGMLGYLSIFITCFLALGIKRYANVIFYLASIGILFSIYLTIIEAAKINSFCPYCLLSFAVISLIGLFSYLAKK